MDIYKNKNQYQLKQIWLYAKYSNEESWKLLIQNEGEEREGGSNVLFLLWIFAIVKKKKKKKKVLVLLDKKKY